MSALRSLSVLLLGVATSCGSDEETAGIGGRCFGCIGGGRAGFGASSGAAATTTGGLGGSGGMGVSGTTNVDAEAGALNPLCGTGTCSLDDPYACSDAAPAVPDAGADRSVDSGAADAQGGVDGSGEAGDAAGMQYQNYFGPDMDVMVTEPFLDAATTTDGATEAAPTPDFGCRLHLSASGERLTECAPAGNGTTAAPCVSSADCAAGYACTGDLGVGSCRKFCCAGNDQCDQGRYCAERPLLESSAPTTKPIPVPVCVIADDCNLAEQYPCPAGIQCKCRPGTACTIVRDDPPTTSCLPPGTGLEGEPCPCAWGYFCSQGTGKCVKLCSISASSTECGSGLCQANTTLPQGWGICVGTSSDGG